MKPRKASRKYYEDDVKEVISKSTHPEYAAGWLLDEKRPKAKKKFDKIMQDLKDLQDYIKEVFPDSRYYTSGGDCPAILLGRSHDEKDKAQRNLCAHSTAFVFIDGGDW